MKNKLWFIMPRLIGATVITGVTALVVGALFKLLLGLTFLAGVITLIARSIGKHKLLPYQHDEVPGLGKRNAFGNRSFWNSPVHPATGYATQKATTIVPVD